MVDDARVSPFEPFSFSNTKMSRGGAEEYVEALFSVGQTFKLLFGSLSSQKWYETERSLEEELPTFQQKSLSLNIFKHTDRF